MTDNAAPEVVIHGLPLLTEIDENRKAYLSIVSTAAIHSKIMVGSKIRGAEIVSSITAPRVELPTSFGLVIVLRSALQ